MWPYPKIVAHRGGGTLAPENTLAGFRCGLAHGFRAVEFDVMLAGDGVPVLMHDVHFGRTVAGDGNVVDFTAQALGEMDAGSWFGAAFAGERVPTYWQALQFCRQNNIWMNVEIKPVPDFEEETGRVVATQTRQFYADDPDTTCPMPLFSSFSLVALGAAKAAAPEFARGCLFDVVPADWRAQLDALSAVALHTNHRHLTAAQTAAIRSAGFGVFCYTVNEVARAREILGWGVDGFCTDRIDVIGPMFC